MDERSDGPAPRLRIADLPKSRTVPFELVPDAAARHRLADRLGLDGLRKLRLSGTLIPVGQKDWRLEANLGATVVQPCVVSLAPVTTRIEEVVTRTFLAAPPPPPEGEVEVPDDESEEPLPDVIDLGAIMAEALALALPAYPRADDAELGAARFAEPGVDPLSDEDARPFSGLAAFRDKLGKDEG